MFGTYYVYMMSNSHHTLYIGMTNNLERRLAEHKQSVNEGFTAKYRCTWLVYFETFSDARPAIDREKQLKGWKRERKVELILAQNPKWRDLSENWNQPFKPLSASERQDSSPGSE